MLVNGVLMLAVVQARRVLSVEILEAFPDACATGHIVDITPAAYAQGSSDIASIAAHQELQSDAIAPVSTAIVMLHEAIA